MSQVLVVDDHAYVRRAVRRVLVRAGHQVWDVPDGRGALQLLHIQEFDLVITDVDMTQVEGMELVARAQRLGSRVPVIVMSNGGFVPWEALLHLAGACGTFAMPARPFTPHEFTETAGTALKVAAA